ncbi:MAG: low specificity L-threonine aldolase [Bacteroidales bacterium]|nr:low specificity L-threonine aldolase [Bacteroidales bacterium]
MKSFASDNWSGVHPVIMDAIINANIGHHQAYGDDDYTKYAQELFRSIFGAQSSTYFVFTGTAANILALENVSHSFNAIICSEHAHINVDECGAIEKHTGSKLITLPTDNGKITVEQIRAHIKTERYPHQSEPAVISITQVTELGTVYSLSEIKAIADLAHENGLYLHIDGARISNAAVALDTDFKTMITDTGVDILSFGGTKAGMMFGEAVVFLKPELNKYFELYRKQAMQLSSKMHFIAAQFIALLSKDLWKQNATNSNNMAKYLAILLQEFPSIKLTQKVESNGIWAVIPKEIALKMQKAQFFYPWDEKKSEYRLMMSWDTTKKEIDDFVKVIGE